MKKWRETKMVIEKIDRGRDCTKRDCISAILFYVS